MRPYAKWTRTRCNLFCGGYCSIQGPRDPGRLMLGQSRDVHRAISNFGDGGYLPIKVPYTTVGATVLGLQDSLGLPRICCGSTGHQ